MFYFLTVVTGRQRTLEGAKRSQNGIKREVKGTKREPKGAKRELKVDMKREPKGAKGAKGGQRKPKAAKGSRRERKGKQKGTKRRHTRFCFQYFSNMKMVFSRKNQVLVLKMLSRRSSAKWHGKWKENGRKSKRFRDAGNVSRIALCEEFTTFVISENVVKSMLKRRGKVIENGRKSSILASRAKSLAFLLDFG